MQVSKRRTAIIGMISLSLAACAVNDVNTSPPPPLTLQPAATIINSGNCVVTGELERWLQITVQAQTQFKAKTEEASVKNRRDIYNDVLELANLRDVVLKTPTPDCGQEVQALLTGTMQQIIEIFQVYYNDQTANLDGLGEQIQTLNQVTVFHSNLIAIMEAQYQIQNQSG